MMGWELEGDVNWRLVKDRCVVLLGSGSYFASIRCVALLI